MNDGYIENLPSNCCVEMPCLINSDGYTPENLVLLNTCCIDTNNINVQILTAEAAITKKRHIYHAALLDPLTAANLTIDENIFYDRQND